MGHCNLCAQTFEHANMSRPPNASNPSIQKLIGYQIRHLQTLMQLDQYTVHQNRAAPSPILDALWLPLTVDPCKMHLLAQIRCPSKGQSSAVILTYKYLMFIRYIIENAEELKALSANLKWYYYISWMFTNKYMCYWLNIALNLIARTLYSVTTQFLLKF